MEECEMVYLIIKNYLFVLFPKIPFFRKFSTSSQLIVGNIHSHISQVAYVSTVDRNR